MITIKLPDDDITLRRIRRAIDKRLAELRATGWLVSVVDDLEVALMVDLFDGESTVIHMLVDPEEYIAPTMRRLRCEARA